jgi:hypothetical protein
MSLIEYNVTTNGIFWGVFEVIYYNPYYKKKRPNQGDLMKSNDGLASAYGFGIPEMGYNIFEILSSFFSSIEITKQLFCCEVFCAIA